MIFVNDFSVLVLCVILLLILSTFCVNVKCMLKVKLRLVGCLISCSGWLDCVMFKCTLDLCSSNVRRVICDLFGETFMQFYVSPYTMI